MSSFVPGWTPRPHALRSTLPALLAATLVLAACGGNDSPESAPGSEADLEARARAIHERVLTIDTHDDIPFTFATPGEGNDPGIRDGRQVTLPKMREGGLDAGFFIVYVGQMDRRSPAVYDSAKALARTKFRAIHRMTDTLYADQIGLAYTPDDVERIHAEGRLVAAIGIENGFVIGKDLSLVEEFYDRGARYMTLAHNGHNDISDSAQPRLDHGDPREEHGGVSPFGEEVIAEMNRLGMMVDVSHISKNAMMDAVRLSRAPVLASHSSTIAVADHPRNMDDEQLRAMRDNGGVVQITALGAFVKVDAPEKGEAVRALREEMGLAPGGAGGGGFGQALARLDDEQRAEYDRRMAEINEQWPPASIQDFVDHVDHAVSVAGIDHVGISSDFDGGGGIVGWQDAAETFNVTLELVRRGYTEEQIAKLWSGNVLRVWREVDRVAAEIQAATAQEDR
jgi:membrane dipeptidase